MALGPRLDLRQSQSLVMTPQLQQAIRLLALSNLEVESFIAEEIDKNPLLESGGDDEGAGEFDRPVERAERSEPEAIGSPDDHDGPAGDAPLDIDINDENLHQ